MSCESSNVAYVENFLRRPTVAMAAFALMLAFANHSLASGHGHAAAADEHEEVAISDAQIQGINLGEFQIRAYYPVEAQKSSVRFVMYAAVARERFEETRNTIDSNQHKIRDEIITVARMTPLPLFDEAELKSFRRRIVIRLRRALPELAIDDVYVCDFQLAVKSL